MGLRNRGECQSSQQMWTMVDGREEVGCRVALDPQEPIRFRSNGPQGTGPTSWLEEQGAVGGGKQRIPRVSRALEPRSKEVKGRSRAKDRE